MAGRVVVSTLNNDTGVLATQNGMTGISKAWVNFNGTNGSIRSSFNVSSVTRNSTGDYTVTYTTALPDNAYAYFALGRRNNSVTRPQVLSQPSTAAYDPLTTSIRFNTWCDGAGGLEDPANCSFSAFSS
jgi:hypothetical protein